MFMDFLKYHFADVARSWSYSVGCAWCIQSRTVPLISGLLSRCQGPNLSPASSFLPFSPTSQRRFCFDRSDEEAEEEEKAERSAPRSSPRC